MATIGRRRGEEAREDRACNLFGCFCCWSKYCKPHIRRFAPGRDHINMPSDADDAPLWSVLVGCISAKVPFHNLRLHRFRVAASGRVIGHTNDMLEPLLTVSPDDDENMYISHATAALAPDGLQLYGFCTHSPGVDGAISSGLPPANAALQFPHRAFAVNLDTKSLSPLPPLPFQHGTYMTVSARGKLWAPSVEDNGVHGDCLRLVMRRLDYIWGDAAWEEAASVDILYQPLVNSHLSGYHLQGYAVIGDRFILLSLIDSTFFCFDCAASTLTPVITVGKFSEYIPISGKGAHFGGNDDMVYFLRCAKLFAYKFSPEEGKLLAPPMEVDRLWPYYEEGYGSVVHLTGHMLCAVWINMNLPCGCAERHALITTFFVKGGHNNDDSFVPSSVEVLHSTCRRVGMLRSRAVPRYDSLDYFCFSEEYLDHAAKEDSSVPSSMMGGFSYTQVEESPDDMPNCCRDFLSGGAPRLKDCKSLTRPDFYFICQVNDRSLVYQISIIGGKLTCHEKLLEPQLSLDTPTSGECGVDEPPSWHFVHQGSKLYVIPSSPLHNHYEVDVRSKLSNLIEQERPDLSFSVVSRAGQYIVALGDTLQDVYILDEPTFKWLPFNTSSGSVDLTRKVNISGFVDLIDDMFVVSDADMAECFLLDLSKKEWFVVKPPLGVWQTVEGVLCGRCLFAEGFIYACSGIGFIAFELLKEDTSYRLGLPVLMEFAYIEFPDRKLVSFDLICKEDNPKSLLLCVVEGCVVTAPFTSHHKLATTTVEVKLEETAQGRKKPVEIDHIDISNSTIDHEGWIWTNFAFSL